MKNYTMFLCLAFSGVSVCSALLKKDAERQISACYQDFKSLKTGLTLFATHLNVAENARISLQKPEIANDLSCLGNILHFFTIEEERFCIVSTDKPFCNAITPSVRNDKENILLVYKISILSKPEPVAKLIYKEGYNLARIESIIVHHTHRKKGIGRTLMN